MQGKIQPEDRQQLFVGDALLLLLLLLGRGVRRARGDVQRGREELRMGPRRQDVRHDQGEIMN